MQRSKQQALMFLLGAVLVGGVLGFSADRVLGRDKPRDWPARSHMYDDLGLSQEQRTRMDSLLDDRSCQISAIMKPVRVQLDSIKAEARRQMMQMLTPQQRERFELRRQELARRDSIRESKRESNRRRSEPTKATNCR